jgi:hypothetical protein
MLPFFRFWIRVAEFAAMVDPWKGRIVTDSQSVLKTLLGGDMDPQGVEEPEKIDGNTVVLDVLCPNSKSKRLCCKCLT